MNFLRQLRGSSKNLQGKFEDELLNHSDEIWKEFHLDTTIPGLRMWKRLHAPVGQAVYFKFTSFFPHTDSQTFLPLLWEPSLRTWDPNFVVYNMVERISDNRCIVYSKSNVPRWLQYLKVKPRDYVQETNLRRHRIRPLAYFLTLHSIQHPEVPEVPDCVRGHVHFQGYLIEDAVDNDVQGTRITVLAVNDIKLPARFYGAVPTVMRRYPIKWYTHLAAAVGCVEKPRKWRPSPIPWLSDSEYIHLCYLPG
eukprot:EG_transcript_22246